MQNKRKYIVRTNKDINWSMFTNGIRHKELPQSNGVIWLLARTILSNSSLIQFVHKRWTGCTDWQMESEKDKMLIGLTLVVLLSSLIPDAVGTFYFCNPTSCDKWTIEQLHLLFDTLLKDKTFFLKKSMQRHRIVSDWRLVWTVGVSRWHHVH